MNGSIGSFAGAVIGLPYVALPVIDVGVRIQLFGPIVVAGVLIGAEVMQRYGKRRGLSGPQLRSLLRYVIVSGLVGAHVFELLAYQPHRLAAEGPLVIFKVWDGISSFGGFLGGAIGQLVYLHRHRLAAGVVFDTTGVGLLVAFSIGRIGCTLVHDHVGRATDFVLGVDYPREVLAVHGLESALPGQATVIRAHHLGMYELAWLMAVCVMILFVAFRRQNRFLSGQLAVITTLLYVPFRFGLEFLRRSTTDPRYAGLTFAQWGSIVAFTAAAAAGLWLRNRHRDRSPP